MAESDMSEAGPDRKTAQGQLVYNIGVETGDAITSIRALKDEMSALLDVSEAARAERLRLECLKLACSLAGNGVDGGLLALSEVFRKYVVSGEFSGGAPD